VEEHKPIFKSFSNGARLTILFFVINFLVLFANLYLSNGYVSKAAYEADLKDQNNRRETLNIELRNIAIELRGINDHMQGDARQDKRLDDLEMRMRDQEKKR
jgi:hypothetical protein